MFCDEARYFILTLLIRVSLCSGAWRGSRTDVDFWCVSINKTKTPVSGSLSLNAMNAGRVIVVSYVLSRTHRIHQIAITEIARIICSVEPEMLHHFYDEHRTEHRYVWPVRAVAGFIMRVKFSWGGAETAGTIFCLTMRIISHCQSRIVGHNIRTY